MKKQILICASAILLAGTGALAHHNRPTEPDAYTGATPEVETPKNVVGNKEVSQKQLVGTWGDPTGVAAYETEELLEQAGGKQTADAIGAGINEVMTRMGVNDVTVEFLADGTITATSPSGKVEGTYTVEGSTLTVTANGTDFQITANVHGKKLQLFYPVSRMPQQVLQYFMHQGLEGLFLGVELKRQ